ncbi:MAG: NAD-dependent epimerase/dehydratase family protein [Bryobacterales bacterium]|nr:NAD-dependent epimerase/dehydratase family protein [Bryobacterales bacterium]
MKVLIIGGNLFIGERLSTQLLKQGHDVTILHRRSSHSLDPRIQNLQADRNDAEAMKNVLADARFDVVFDNVYDWERGTTADQVRASAMAAGPDRLQRYVFMSSVAAYFTGLDHIEDDELAGDDCPDSYCRQKAQSERALFKLHQQKGLPVVTMRPPFIYGPRNPFYREAFFWDRLLLNRPIIVPDDGSRLMHFVHVQDLVTCCLRVIEEPSAVGEAFNVGNRGPISQLNLVHSLATAAGVEANVVHIPREVIQSEGGNFMHDPLYFAVYFDIPPIGMRIDKASERLHFEPTDFAEGLKQTFDWYVESGTRRTDLDFSFEDRLIALARS